MCMSWLLLILIVSMHGSTMKFNGNNNNPTTLQKAHATDQGVLYFHSSTHVYRMCPNVISFALIGKQRPSLSRSARHPHSLGSIACSFTEIRQ